MTWTKLFVVMILVSAGSAVLVGIVSRVPASVRNDRPGPEAQDPSLGATFTDQQIARHGAYRKQAYVGFALGTLIPILLLVLLARGPFRDLVTRVETWRGGWPVHAIAVAIAVTLLTTLFLLPLGLVRGYFISHAWGLSTQDLGGWLSDQFRGLLVGAVVAAVSAVAFFGVVRWQPRSWWLWGWGTFSLLTALLFFLYPVLIAPLFNKFTSLEEGPLRDRIMALGQDAGVPLKDVEVADASRRTTSENAYVAGLGSTQKMVLYDTLLANGGDDETVFIAAHELGHRRENHVLKNVFVSSAGMLVGFGLLYLLTRRAGFLAWAGADAVSDLRAMPLLLLYMTVMTLVTLPVQNSVSRAFERRADEIAIELTQDPAPGVEAFRRLAFANIADLRPPSVAVWALYTHPPIPERIESLLQDGP